MNARVTLKRGSYPRSKDVLVDGRRVGEACDRDAVPMGAATESRTVPAALGMDAVVITGYGLSANKCDMERREYLVKQVRPDELIEAWIATWIRAQVKGESIDLGGNSRWLTLSECGRAEEASRR